MMFRTLESFYKSDQFDAFKRTVISERTNKSDGIIYCQHCGKPIVKKYDTIVHHKKELTIDNVNDYSISMNKDMVIVVHFKCHNEIHVRFGFEGRKKAYIVYGSPCSGKSTWVNDQASPNDLIVDMGSIYQMISINPKYTKPQRLAQNVFAVRDFMYEQIRLRNGKWQAAYIIAGLPMQMERERLELRLNASSILINTEKEICMKRACLRPNAEETKKYIEEWFERYDGG